MAPHPVFALRGEGTRSRSANSELHQNGHARPVFGFPQIRLPSRNDRSRIPVVSSWGCHAAGAAPVRHVRVAMIELPTKGDVLAGHVVVSARNVPSLKGIARIFRKVRSPGGGGGSVDGRQQDQVAPGVVDLAAANGYPVAVPVKPEAVVEHEAEEALLVIDSSAGVAFVGGAVHAAAGFAARVTRQAEGHLVQELFRTIVVLDFDAVVGVIASAVGNSNRVSTDAVVVGDNRKPRSRPPEDLTAKSQSSIRTRVGLPPVDNPGLDLQLLRREYLDSHAGEKPRG